MLTVNFHAVAHAQVSRPVVVLSPGHGQLAESGTAIDPGAVYKGLNEKDINLEVAKYTQSFLKRCPLDIYLTRDGDDHDHRLTDVDEIVNALNPTIGVAIHTNSGGAKPSGAEGWYTVKGNDDENSKKLAGILSKSISTQFGIKDLGTKSETSNRHGGLYIHWWKTPSALIEIGYLQGDFEILKNNQKDFGRAIAKAILEYLEISPTCADNAIQQDIYASTYFPDDSDNNTIRILNDGVAPWNVGDYELKNNGDTYGAKDSYALPRKIVPGEIAEWQIPVKAPSNSNVYQQQWQIYRGEETVGKRINVYIIVVPQEAKELKENIDKQIEEIKKQGQEAIDNFIEELKKQAIEWVKKKYVDPYLPDCSSLYVLILVACLVSVRVKRP